MAKPQAALRAGNLERRLKIADPSGGCEQGKRLLGLANLFAGRGRCRARAGNLERRLKIADPSGLLAGSIGFHASRVPRRKKFFHNLSV